MPVFKRLVIVDGRIYLKAGKVDAARLIIRHREAKTHMVTGLPVDRYPCFCRSQYRYKRYRKAAPLVAEIYSRLIVAAENTRQGRVPKHCIFIKLGEMYILSVKTTGFQQAYTAYSRCDFHYMVHIICLLKLHTSIPIFIIVRE